MIRRRTGSYQAMAERRFRHRVDIEVPALGLGQRLTTMLDWCGSNVSPDDWAQHGYLDMTTASRPTDYTRFYFACPVIAKIFSRTFNGYLRERE